MSRLLIAGELMNPLRRQTCRLADLGERLSVCVGGENSLAQSSLRLDEIQPGSGNTLQVATGFNFSGGHSHPVCSLGLDRTREAQESGYAPRWVTRGTANPVSPLMAVLTLSACYWKAVFRAESCSQRMRRGWSWPRYSLPCASLLRSALCAVSGTASVAGVSMSVLGIKADFKAAVKQTLQRSA